MIAGASVASVVIGLTAQSTLRNLVAGIAITIYRPFRLGDTLQVATPTGTEIGVVELISLGYTKLRARELALAAARETVEEKAVIGCFLTKMHGASVTLDLRVVAADAASRDTLRSKLIANLARRFAASHANADAAAAELPAFS